jgi:hypothetical protein
MRRSRIKLKVENRKIYLVVATVLWLCSLDAAGQEPVDSTYVSDSDIILISDTVDLARIFPLDSLDVDAYAKHSPAKAAMMSAVVPGLGQIYNRQYWKVPIVYLAIGISVERFLHYQNLYNRYRRAYIDIKDNDPYTNFHRTLGFPSGYSDTQIEQLVTKNKETLRTYRDYAILAVVGTYMLNIIDANVFAHLKDFSLDDNLSLNIRPCFLENGFNSQIFGLTLQFSF